MRIYLRLLVAFLLLSAGNIVYAEAQQEKRVTGTVTSEGEPLPGVSVQVKGASSGTITDIDGNYSIEAPANGTIVFRFVGMRTVEQSVNNRNVINVTLESESKELDEVMVVAYVTAKKYSFTGAASTMKAGEIEKLQTSSVSRVLEGTVSGVQASAASGQPGTDAEIRIRGIGSINASSAPLYVVDGVPFDGSVNSINPDDISSMTVLKDAASAALYGSRGANGVIIITTKQGEQDSKATVKVKASLGGSNRAVRDYDRVSTNQYFELYWEALRNQYAKSSDYTPETAAAQASKDLVTKLMGGGPNPYGTQYPQPVGTDGKLLDGARPLWNSDWSDAMEQQALRTELNLSVSGGGKSNQYFFSAGYLNDKGIALESGYQRFNLRSNVTSEMTSWLKGSINLSFAHSMQNYPVSSDSKTSNVITAGRTMPGFYPIYEMNTDGSYKLNEDGSRIYDFGSYRPSGSMANWNLPATLPLDKSERMKDEFSGRTYLEATIIEGLKFKTSFNFDLINYNTLDYTNPKIGPALENGGGSSRLNSRTFSWTWNNIASYDKTIGDHHFNVLAGMEAYSYRYDELTASRTKMAQPDMPELVVGSQLTGGSGYRIDYALVGYLTQLLYDYQDKYFFSASYRRDGSSRFAPGHRWGFFPSFSAGYDIARTDYFQKLKLPFSQLKVRVSYGRLGNQNGAGYYDYIGVMPLVAAEPNAWILPGVNVTPVKGTIAKTPKMVSPYITWEKVDNANLGLDLMLLDNRLSITADIYQRTTHDMIGPAEAIPSIGGIAASDRAKVNNATLRNRGWELSVNWHDQLKCGFSYGVGFNLFNYKAVVTKYNNPEGLIYNNHTGLDTNKGYYEGMDVGEIWGYQADDLFMSNREIDDYIRNVDLSFFKPNSQWQRGDLKYLDVNGDGKVDPGKGTLSDHGDLRVIGNATPKYSFGINLNLGYKGFEVSTLLQGVAKRDFPLAGSTYLFGGKNFFKEHLDYFNADHPNGYLPRLTEFNKPDYQANSAYNNSRYLVNAAYMRMKNLMVSYTFNKKMLRHIGIENLKVYFTCDNLFTITKLPKQFDPETLNQVNTWAGGSNESAPGLTSPAKENGNGKVYPMNRNFVFGLDFTF